MYGRKIYWKKLYKYENRLGSIYEISYIIVKKVNGIFMIEKWLGNFLVKKLFLVFWIFGYICQNN